MKKDLYTRAELITALTVGPCHRDEEHHERTCTEQVRDVTERLLSFLEIAPNELPRRLHDGGCWACLGPDEKAKSARAWAGVTEEQAERIRRGEVAA